MTESSMGSGDQKDSELEREIREGRKFTPEEALARLAGPGAMKGASPVSRVNQAETEVGTWLRSNVADATGALHVILHRELKGSRVLLANLDEPLTAIEKFLRHILALDDRLKEVISAADVEWGRAMNERPFFEKDGVPAHADDPYTLESVRRSLSEALGRLTT